MKFKRMLTLLLILVIAATMVSGAYALGNVKDLHTAHGIKIDNGKLIDEYHDNKEIGNVTPIESVDAGEEKIFEQDPNALQDVLSTDPLVTEYIVDGTADGIYFMFGHDGDVFLAFVPTDNMGGNMLKRMTEFCQYQGVIK